ncbi:MAG: AMP-binding protein [Acidobacteria bacterium]|nr:AMP-binding protein [Acidobacteriota bacterium]
MARGLREGGVTALAGVPRLFYLIHKRIFDGLTQRPLPVRKLFAATMSFNGWLRDALGLNAGRFLFRRVHEALGGVLRLMVSGGASFDTRVARDFHRLGFTLLQGYGLTETSGAATVTRMGEYKPGSVGRPLPGIQIRIDRPDVDGVGEVLIRGANVTPGYYGNPEATVEAFTSDGWFRTGDLGRVDRQGNLSITGRRKDLIVLPSGVSIYPEDVEAHYERSRLISEICVLGRPDVEGGFTGAEKLCGVVVPDFDFLKANRIASVREAIRYELDNLGRTLPDHERIRDYILRSEPLPRTTTGKVRRFEVREQLEQESFGARRRGGEKWALFTPEAREIMDSPAGSVVAAAIREQVPDVFVIHPDMILELDLGLDSLARAECVVRIERGLGVDLEPEAEASAHTVREFIEWVEATAGSGVRALTGPAWPRPGLAATPLRSRISGCSPWRELLADSVIDVPEITRMLKRKWLGALAVYLVLRLVRLAAWAFLRLEVRGLDVLSRVERPFLICANHQSYIDPIILCSTYPFRILRHVFHMGASEYFGGFFSAALAHWINIVPVDPDTHLIRALRAGAAGLRAGKILHIYPEGQRSFDGTLQEFRRGAAILATELEVPIVPVALDGLYRVWPRGSRRMRLAKVRIHFGGPVRMQAEADAGALAETRYAFLAALVQERVQEMLDEMH